MTSRDDSSPKRLTAKTSSRVFLPLLVLTAVWGLTNSVHVPPACAQSSCVTPPSGLVSWWPGDGNANDITDGNPGTLIGDVTFTAGMVGQAFNLPGSATTDSRVEAADAANLQITGPITLDAWVSFSGVSPQTFGGSSNSPIVAKWGDTNNGTAGYGLFVYADGTVLFAVSSTGSDVIPAFSITKLGTAFTHVAGVYDGAYLNLYVNGALEASTPFSGSIHANNGVPLLIGGYSSTFTSGHNDSLVGVVDEVEVFNAALTSSQISAIYNAESAGKCRTCTTAPSGLVSWWPADGNTIDITGGNNGTLQNGATFTAGEVGQAFSFDGVGAFVDAGDINAINGVSQMTIDLWAKADVEKLYVYASKSTAGADAGWIFQNYNGAPYGKPNFFFGSTGTQARTVTDVITTGTYYHLAAVFDGTGLTDADRIKIYVNGVQQTLDFVGGSGVPTTLSATATSFQIGGWAGNTAFFEGTIDEVEIFNRALSAEDINAIVNAGNAGKCKQGCSPGFWKNHQTAWGSTPYSTTQTLEAVFDVPDPFGLDNVNLLNALSLKGGSTLAGAAQTLLRAAVAALLNASDAPAVHYPRTATNIISDVNTALGSGDRATMLSLASTLNSYNNLFCPLSQ